MKEAGGFSRWFSCEAARLLFSILRFPLGDVLRFFTIELRKQKEEVRGLLKN